MDPQWDEGSPIYRQLRDRVVAMILEGVLREGDPLPSVRSVAAEFRLNPLTVLKGYQQLVDENLVEKRRGRGMFVNAGARQALMKDEKQRFLDDEWPKVHASIVRLGLSLEELPARHAAPTTPAQASAAGAAAVLRREPPAADDATGFDDGMDGGPDQGGDR
jgi:GntR family transcriptional regulator